MQNEKEIISHDDLKRSLQGFKYLVSAVMRHSKALGSPLDQDRAESFVRRYVAEYGKNGAKPKDFPTDEVEFCQWVFYQAWQLVYYLQAGAKKIITDKESQAIAEKLLPDIALIANLPQEGDIPADQQLNAVIQAAARRTGDYGTAMVEICESCPKLFGAYLKTRRKN